MFVTHFESSFFTNIDVITTLNPDHDQNIPVESDGVDDINKFSVDDELSVLFDSNHFSEANLMEEYEEETLTLKDVSNKYSDF